MLQFPLLPMLAILRNYFDQKMEITAIVEEKLQITIQNQSQTFTKEVQFLRMENTAKHLKIQALEEKSLVQKGVIEKLSSEIKSD